MNETGVLAIECLHNRLQHLLNRLYSDRTCLAEAIHLPALATKNHQENWVSVNAKIELLEPILSILKNIMEQDKC